MAHVGRPRRSGSREPNGRLKRLAAADRAKQLGERGQVLAQPHRRGEIDQKAESPLGRLVLRHKLPQALFDAGLELGRLYRRVLKSRARFADIHEIRLEPASPTTGSGSPGLSSDVAIRLQRELDRIIEPLNKSDPIGFSALRTLTVFEREIAVQVEPAAIECLHALAVALHKFGKRETGWVVADRNVGNVSY